MKYHVLIYTYLIVIIIILVTKSSRIVITIATIAKHSVAAGELKKIHVHVVVEMGVKFVKNLIQNFCLVMMSVVQDVLKLVLLVWL